jgi:hypothetical protein
LVIDQQLQAALSQIGCQRLELRVGSKPRVRANEDASAELSGDPTERGALSGTE